MQAASIDELKLLFEKERPTHIIVRGKGEVILLRQGEKSKSEILDIDKHDLNEIARICDSLKIAFN